MKAVFLDFGTMGADALDPASLYLHLPDLTVYDSTPPAQTAERIADAEYVFVNKVKLDAATLSAARHLRFIGLAATGTDNVDLDAAARQGIAVCNIRAYCTQSVVEHVFAQLLTLAHGTHRYRADVRRGEWQHADNFCLLDHPIRELSAMTLGIVGYGVLGKAVGAMAENFGMTVLIAKRVGDASDATDGRVLFENVLQRADVVSLHCPLNESTQRLIGAAELRLMPRSSFLINTARGGLVDSAALVAALRAGQIGGAAIDVLAEEPPVSGNALLDYDGDNLLLTPHIAWATQEARQQAIDELAANVAAFQSGERRNRLV